MESSKIHFDAHPPKQGLYDPALEKDACGVGFVADTSGIPTHATVKDAAEILRHLTHRGKMIFIGARRDGRICICDLNARARLPCPIVPRFGLFPH
jgi:hypothetical protein